MTDDDQSSVPPAPCPGTPEEWRAYLTEYSDWALRTLDEEELARLLGPTYQLLGGGLSEQQVSSRWLGYEPADEQLIAATEERLGVPLPPSLRSFLRTSNGWWRVAGWIDSLHPCADIGWFTESFGEEWLNDDGDGSDDVFRHGLVIAQGEDVFLLDTSDVLETGEYRAYLLAVKYGTLDDPCDSFSELLTLGREEFKDTIQ
ncbi:SMI1/KNR4 family protein [Streptomyces sp. NPDC001928]|uniref:SMI1/KNR4 family protein n=1 Tax=Streptomyces sp. NPDC001928 TaxID=3154404 RepID=UPI003328687D